MHGNSWLALIGFGIIVPTLISRFPVTIHKGILWIGTILLVIGYGSLLVYTIQNMTMKEEPNKTIRTIGHSSLAIFFLASIIIPITFHYSYYDLFAIVGHTFFVIATYIKDEYLMQIAIISLVVHYTLGSIRKISSTEWIDKFQLVARVALVLYYTTSIKEYSHIV